MSNVAFGPGNEGEMLRDLVRKYLSTRHTTVWGKSFTVTSPEGLDNAVEFLASAMEGVLAVGQDDGKLKTTFGAYHFTAEPIMEGDGGVRYVTVVDNSGKVVDRVECDVRKPMTPERLAWIGKEWVDMLNGAMQELGGM